MGGRNPRAYTDQIVLVDMTRADHDKTCCHAIAELSHNNVTELQHAYTTGTCVSGILRNIKGYDLYHYIDGAT